MTYSSLLFLASEPSFGSQGRKKAKTEVISEDERERRRTERVAASMNRAEVYSKVGDGLRNSSLSHFVRDLLIHVSLSYLLCPYFIQRGVATNQPVRRVNGGSSSQSTDYSKEREIAHEWRTGS